MPRTNVSFKDKKQAGGKFLLPYNLNAGNNGSEPWAHQKCTGIIGVACVLNLLTGGFEMKRLGIPSQCVFLDNPGCKKHWLSGKPSEVNLSAFTC